jgi:Nucleotide modification associated domain 1
MSDRGFTEGMRIVSANGFLNSADGLSIKPNNSSPTSSSDFVANVWDIMDSAGNLLIKKHKDYGPTNISRSPGGPLNGLRVRMWDKTARINHLIDSGATPENESLRDSFIDLLNYAAIAMMVIDGTWPE